MNTLHLKYAVEVEKTGSITKAAESLYMNQPHLSKAIKELEESLGITIFNRTSKGVVPTLKGSEFLVYAKNILSQIEEMETLYKSNSSNNFKISVPRATYISHSFIKFVKSLTENSDNKIDINYRETNSVRIIKNVSNGEDNIGIVRYQSIYEKYFLDFIEEKDLDKKKLWSFKFFALISKSHPLSNKDVINYEELKNFIEISHGDLVIPSLPLSKAKQIDMITKRKNRITIYERASQFEILTNIPSSYMLVSPIQQEILNRFNLIQKKCIFKNNNFKDIIIFKKGHKITENENNFLKILKSTINELDK